MSLPSSLITTLLSYLVPSPHAPLPPDLMSTALLQRHQFLPPPLDDPIAHFSPRSNTLQSTQRTADLVQEVARLMGSGEHPPLTPTYKLPDSHTLQARILLFATYNQDPSLELKFVHESAERGWRFHELKDLSDPSPPEDEDGWVEDVDQVKLPEKQIERETGDQDEDEDGQGDEEDAGDFWGGYDSPTSPDSSFTSPEEAQVGSKLESKGSSASLDDYWTRYDGVEDGLAPTAPPTPHFDPPYSDHPPTSAPSPPRGAASPSSEEQPVYGTGGETPVGWTPVHGMTPALEINPLPLRSPNGFYARRKTSTQVEDEGTYPTFPVPPFKGLTPASGTFDLPEVDSRSFQTASPEASSSSTFPSSSAQSTLKRPSLQTSLFSSTPTAALLEDTLSSLLRMHLFSTKGTLLPSQATAEFVEVAKKVAREAAADKTWAERTLAQHGGGSDENTPVDRWTSKMFR